MKDKYSLRNTRLNDINHTKNYIYLYKAKYEGVSTIKDIDNPEYWSKDFKSYINKVEEEKNNDLFNTWMFMLGLFFFILLGSCINMMSN